MLQLFIMVPDEYVSEFLDTPTLFESSKIAYYLWFLTALIHIQLNIIHA